MKGGMKHKRPICVICNKKPGRPRSDGRGRGFHSKCWRCTPSQVKYRNKHKKDPKSKTRINYRQHLKRSPHRKYLKTNCELCGFIPVHRGQMDVDHKNGNHLDNDPKNLQTLCANCHRLKTIKGRGLL